VSGWPCGALAEVRPDLPTCARSCCSPKVIDPVTGEPVAPGAVGELCARGYGVMAGQRQPGGTAAALDADGWYHTGDLASMDERGYLRIEGRLKDMIIRGGENIYPREIEALLFAHPDVADVAVIGKPDERRGEVRRGLRTSREPRWRQWGEVHVRA
jgi:acyl-CoA synthetase (AMP-forming)/AMP-acid ligase II